MMKRIIWGIALSALAAGAANAALLGRVPTTSGGTDYQAYYDTELNITWVADANLAASNTFGVSRIFDIGSMTWDKANEWIGAMNSASYLGVTNWRLPKIVDTGEPGCSWGYSGTDCGYNVDLSTGEMAHLYYSTLGNVGLYDTSGIATGCSAENPRCLTNTGPFSNFLHWKTFYWSSTTFAPNPELALGFNFSVGTQNNHGKGAWNNALAVRDGDIGNVGAVPAPGALWLFGTGLVAVAAKLRRRVGHEAE